MEIKEIVLQIEQCAGRKEISEKIFELAENKANFNKDTMAYFENLIKGVIEGIEWEVDVMLTHNLHKESTISLAERNKQTEYIKTLLLYSELLKQELLHD